MVAWWWAKDGHSTGPVAWEELRAAAKRGEFGPTDWVWTPGYGAEWKKASVLDALFPPSADEKQSEAKDGAAAENTEGWSEARPAGPPAPGDIPSPFAETASDGRKPETPRSMRSLRLALVNVKTLIASPFSWRRYLAFAFATLLLIFGSQAAAPAGFNLAGMAERISGGGLDIAGSLASFSSKWATVATQGAIAAADREAMTADFITAVKGTASSFVDWLSTTHRHPVATLALLLALCVTCAVHAWFLSRGWTVLIHRVYRRDEPVVRTWEDSRTPARAIFRGALALRLALGAVWGAAIWACAARLAAMPDSGPAPDAVLHALSPVFFVSLADIVTMVFARDFAAPRVVLLGQSFAVALRASLRESGFWTVRYILLLSVVSSIFLAAAGLLVQPLAALAPALFPVFAALLLAPWHLTRALWALDVFFRLHPEARTNVPPRAPLPPAIVAALEEAARRQQ